MRTSELYAARFRYRGVEKTVIMERNGELMERRESSSPLPPSERAHTHKRSHGVPERVSVMSNRETNDPVYGNLHISITQVVP